MKLFDGGIRPIKDPRFELLPAIPPPPESLLDFGDRKEEAKRIVKRLAAIIEDHRLAALRLEIEFNAADISAVFESLREHARGGPGTPVRGARDEIHGYCLDRLFDELVEEPSNVLFTTKTGPDTMRYDSMGATFWIECLDLMEKTYLDK